MDVCNQKNCPFYEKEDGCTHPSAPSPAECDILSVLPKIEDEPSLEPPIYVKFTFRDEWRHIPETEVFPVWTLYDFRVAIFAFRELHRSQGALVVFWTDDSIEWRIWGQVPEETESPYGKVR